MALNNNSHRRNQEAFEYIKRQKRNQKKYDITPESIINNGRILNSSANQLGKNLMDMGEHLQNEKLTNIGKNIYSRTGSNLFNFAKDKINAFKSGADAASKASSMANTANNASNVANTASNASNVASNASNVANAANTASNVSNAANAASNASSAASGASSAASSGASGAPVVGTALGALSAGNNFAKGDNVNGALDVAKTGAAFIPVYGWIASAVISAIQMARNAFMKKKMEAHQATQNEAMKATENSMNEANEKRQEIAMEKAQNQDAFADNPINGQFGNSGLDTIQKPTLQQITNQFVPTAPEPIPSTQPDNLSTITNIIQNAVSQNADNNYNTMSQNTDNNFTGGAAPVGNFAEQGNIDLFNRPVTKNTDGTISTVRSMSFNDGNHEVLIPTVADDGSILSEEDAINNYYKTGKHLGKFNSVEDANQYAESLHNQQEGLYGGMTGGAANIDMKALDNVKYPEQPMTQEQLGRLKKVTPQQQPAGQVQTLQGANDPQYVLPPLPNGSPVASPSGTDYDTTQFEIIEPDGTMHPASQQTQQQVQQTQPRAQQAPPATVPTNRFSLAKNAITRAIEGYNENVNNNFKPNNLFDKQYQRNIVDANGEVIGKENVNKNIWNRIGEGIGTGQRVLSNPLVQGLIAGAIYRATGGDKGESIQYGVDWANNKGKSDFYQKKLDPNARPNILNGFYTAEDWKTKEAIESAKASYEWQKKRAEAAMMNAETKQQEVQQKLDKEKQDNETYTSLVAELKKVDTDKKYAFLPIERKLEIKRDLLRTYIELDKDNIQTALNLAKTHGVDIGK